MAAPDIELIRRFLRRIFRGGDFDGSRPIYYYYRFSSNMREIRRKKGVVYGKSDEQIIRERERGTLRLYGIEVIREATWEEVLGEPQGSDALQIYMRSLLDHEDLEPEEEFLRNYRVVEPDSAMSKFIEMRAKSEMQIYGDMPIRFWAGLIEEISVTLKHVPLGLDVMRQFVRDYGSPFDQNTRDLSHLENFRVSYSTPLLFEMCCAESLLEFNMLLRMEEEKIKNLEFGGKRINPYDVIREFFIVALPHPKKINNMLRSPYSWAVKVWGVAAEDIVILESIGGEDRNSKEVYYKSFSRVKNPYSSMLTKSLFYASSLKDNVAKVNDAIKYSNDLGNHEKGLPIFQSMLESIYSTPFDPSNIKHVILASLLLSIQVMTGYGRAWVMNKPSGDDQMKPAADNFIERVNDYTKQFFIQAYHEAKVSGEEIVKPEDMYTSILRLARNTSSGFSTSVDVYKRYGPKAGKFGEKIKITSRIKALVIFVEGHKVFTRDNLLRKYNSTEFYQSKGSRDVPIKSTRTIYSINLSILVPQLIVTLPLNEYFAHAGGSTLPKSTRLAGKVIIGDLEATGSRVVDAADTFRNSSDPDILTIAIDYSDYDQHLTVHNFRKGMLDGIRSAMQPYAHLRYEGFSLDEIIDFGYGEGRVVNSLWNGKRRVFKVSFSSYLMLSDDERQQGMFKPPIGVKPVSGMHVIDKLDTQGTDYILVAPTDGSDLAMINTHLSGENSTLVANSLHNMAIGRTIQEEVRAHHRGALEVLSEQYVGDDTLFYTKLHTRDPVIFDRIVQTIFDTVAKCGHEASPAKTLIAPFSVEKTQTHAKQGIYIPQDRMMLISSERRKDIENVQGYMRSQAQTMVTKVSRGFSSRLANIIFMAKGSTIGYRKMKRTLLEGGVFRDRKFDSNEEDGFTLLQIRDPLTSFLPTEWGGYGLHPAAMNLVMTEDLLLDSMRFGVIYDAMRMLTKFGGVRLPVWDETKADKRMIATDTQMGFFSKMARPAVRMTFEHAALADEVKKLPLGDYSPFNLSRTMMHGALLKESAARSLLAPAYEGEYQSELNSSKLASFSLSAGNMELSTNYAKTFEVTFVNALTNQTFTFPDQNISPNFFVQKALLGPRVSSRVRMSYIDRLDSILRGDVVMRGTLTANTIMNVLEKIGHSHGVSELTTVFQLMNIEDRVAQRLAEYIAAERVKFDALKLIKRGVGGDEFTMSLDVCTQTMVERFARYPPQFTKSEVDMTILYITQLLILQAVAEGRVKRVDVNVSAEAKVRQKQREARFKTHLPRLRVVNKLMNVDRLSARMVQNQFT
ncbi:VP1 [Lebombo virus]|uniref:RNA-directed RNA polymerase n=1 Tax=Lebombo virus TaxID=40057 RepID=W5QLZ7_9REOV|nr:VP1 [Lebombo virus]AFX73376.1 VP1 [Lebombo virus]